MMKKIMMSLALVMTLLLFTGMSASPEEPTKKDPSGCFDARMALMADQHNEKSMEMTASFEERKADTSPVRRILIVECTLFLY